LKKCSGCGSLIRDEDEQCGVCGHVWSEGEQFVEKTTVDRDFNSMVRRTRILFVLGVVSLGFGIAASVGNGFGSVPVFILGIGMLPLGVWVLANAALAGLGKGAYRKMVERGVSRRGHYFFPSDKPPEKVTEIREEEKREDSMARKERKEEEFD